MCSSCAAVLVTVAGREQRLATLEELNLAPSLLLTHVRLIAVLKARRRQLQEP